MPQNPHRPEEVISGFGTGDMIVLLMFVSFAGFSIAMAWREHRRHRVTP